MLYKQLLTLCVPLTMNISFTSASFMLLCLPSVLFFLLFSLLSKLCFSLYTLAGCICLYCCSLFILYFSANIEFEVHSGQITKILMGLV